jgi:hypothetical protein
MAIDISSTTRRIVYTGSAGVGPYAFNFEVLAQTDIDVYYNDTELTLTTDYTVAINPDGTGAVTIVVGTNVPTTPTASDRITIVGARTIERTTDFTTGGPLFAASLNDEFDSLTIFTQQNKEEADRSIKAPVTDPSSIDMTLPKDDDRKGKYLSFNATTGNPEVVNTVTDVTTIAGIAGDVTTVSGIAANVTTVAGVSANVTTVATNISSVNTVAANIADVITVANDLVEAISEVETVANDLNEATSEIDTVANSIANVDTVGTNITNVNTVATNISNVNAVAGNATNINTVAGNTANITTVAGIDANVTTVATNNANVTTVATNIADVNTVATNITDVVTFATTYLGAFASAPTTSVVGALYYNTTGSQLYVWNGSVWDPAAFAASGTVTSFNTRTGAVTLTSGDVTGALGFTPLDAAATTYVQQTSTTGSGKLPSGTELQRDGSPSAGYIRFNTDATSFEGYDGSAWGAIGGGGGASAGGVIYENSTTISEDYTLTTGTNGFSVGPITISAGFAVTVPSGQRWVVL